MKRYRSTTPLLTLALLGCSAVPAARAQDPETPKQEPEVAEQEPGVAAPEPAAPRPPTTPRSQDAAPAEPVEATGYGPSPGDVILSISGSFTNSDVRTSPRTEASGIAVVGRIGYALTRNWEFGLQGVGSWAHGNSETTTIYALEHYWTYNLRMLERTWLTVGPHFGLLTIDTTGFNDTTYSIGAHLGARQWLTATTSFFVEGRYTYARLGVPGEDAGDHETEILFGFDFRF